MSPGAKDVGTTEIGAGSNLRHGSKSTELGVGSQSDSLGGHSTVLHRGRWGELYPTRSAGSRVVVERARESVVWFHSTALVTHEMKPARRITVLGHVRSRRRAGTGRVRISTFLRHTSTLRTTSPGYPEGVVLPHHPVTREHSRGEIHPLRTWMVRSVGGEAPLATHAPFNTVSPESSMRFHLRRE